MKNGQTNNVNTRQHCITAMKEYENKCLEELRLEDYAANRKGPQAGSVQSSGIFGAQNSNIFSAPASQPQSASLFSTPAAQQNTNLFGSTQPNTSLFTPASQNTGLFNASQPQSTGLFNKPTNTFGTTNTA